MERLTGRIPPAPNGDIVDGVTGNAVYIAAECCECGDGLTNTNPLLDKLAEYEELEEQGLLLRLPCKIGDIVYMHDWREKPRKNVYSGYITEIHVSSKIMLEVRTDGESNFAQNNNWNGGLYHVKDIGETVFLTRSEAEAVLAGRKEAI